MLDWREFEEMKWSLDEAESLLRKLDPKLGWDLEKDIRDLRRRIQESKT